MSDVVLVGDDDVDTVEAAEVVEEDDAAVAIRRRLALPPSRPLLRL